MQALIQALKTASHMHVAPQIIPALEGNNRVYMGWGWGMLVITYHETALLCE